MGSSKIRHICYLINLRNFFTFFLEDFFHVIVQSDYKLVNKMNICVGGELDGQKIERGALRRMMYINIIKLSNCIINSNIYLKSK